MSYSPVRRADSGDTIAMVVEIVFALFGVLGMGWLYAGNLLVSILVFIGYAGLVFVEALLVTGTLGLAACLIVPFNIVLAVVSGLKVRDYMRNTGKSGSLLYLLLGLMAGGAVVCGGLTLLGVAGSLLAGFEGD